MPFKIHISVTAKKQLQKLRNDSSQDRCYKAVIKTLRFLEENPRHPSLNTHEYTALSRELGCKVWEAYAQNHTPNAYRVFWTYGEEQGSISIIAITGHP
ncbi:MAG: hypothetical protein ABW189_05625 [Rickettsiales bacterium]